MKTKNRIYVRAGVDKTSVAKQPKMDVALWNKLAATSPRLITDTTLAASRVAHDNAVAANIKAATKLYKSNPSALARLTGAIDGNARAANPSPTLTFLDATNKPRTVRTVNRDAMVKDALVARALLSSRTNQSNVYASAYKYLAGLAKRDAALAAKLGALPKSFDPAQVAVSQIDMGIAKLTDLARGIVSVFNSDVSSTPPSGHPSSCQQEEGTGNGGDMTDCNPAASLNPNGILKNCNWPLKFYNTCVRNQAARGTCNAFSIVAAIESCIAVKLNRWVNLSEQDLYKHQRYDWFPFDNYDDGYAPPISLLLQLFTGYRFPWERDWDYNPSTHRIDDAAHHVYTHSCDLYGNPNCSDTNHQSHQACYQIDQEVQRTITKTVSTWVEDIITVVEDVVDWFGSLIGQHTSTEVWGHWVEQTVTEVVTDIVSTMVCYYDTNIAGTSGFGVTSGCVFWDPLTGGQVGISLAQLFLASKVPVIYCFYAMPSFDSATQHGGYVIYAGPGEQPPPNKHVSDLGHCVLITGFVNNANLPAGAPPGSGGGYFIVKNSWSTGFGDCGYAYIPYDWTIQWGQAMCTVNSITP
jgi:papain like protease